MGTRKIRVLVVDDSAVIRRIIGDHVSEAPDMELAGTANDGHMALEVLDAANPDVVTLDVQMPNMDGLATLDAILDAPRVAGHHGQFAHQAGGEHHARRPRPRALWITWPSPTTASNAKAAMRDELLRKIRTAAGMDVRRILEIRAAAQTPPRRTAAAAQRRPRNGPLRNRRPRYRRQVHRLGHFDRRPAGA